MRKGLFLILLLLPALAQASITSGSWVPGCTTEPFVADRHLVEIFSQPLDDASWPTCSQYDTSYPFEAWVADDFSSSASIHADLGMIWGGYWNYSVFDHIQGIFVWIWEETGSGTPGYPYDGSEIYYEHVPRYDISITATGGDNFLYEFEMPYFFPVPGQVYWISFQPCLDFYDNGQWGIRMSTESFGHESVQLFPLLGMDPWEIHGNGDMAFGLYSDIISATGDTDWSALKAMY